MTTDLSLVSSSIKPGEDWARILVEPEGDVFSVYDSEETETVP